MRSVLRFFSLLLLFCAAPAFSDPAYGAASTGRDTDVLVRDFKALLADNKKAGLRHNWLNLEERFAALKKKSKGEGAATAAYYMGRTREELARRSANKADFTAAAAYYKEFAATWPRHSLAPDAIYRQARLLGLRLGEEEKARTLINGLQKSHPKSAAAREGETLLRTLARQTGKSRPATAAGGGRKPADTLAEQLGLTVKTIMIDAGHGGKDPGAMANGIVEKQLTLTLARQVGESLRKKGFTVLYTRTGDAYVALEDRTTLANAKKADLFISLHANANEDKAIRGMEVYYLAEATSSSAARVAARENAVSVKNISDLQFILTDLMLSSKLEESHELADIVHRNMLQNVKKGGFRSVDNGVRPAPFYVLMGARMPAILVEVGYITNGNDATLLKNKKYLDLQVEGIVRGVEAYRSKVLQRAK